MEILLLSGMVRPTGQEMTTIEKIVVLLTDPTGRSPGGHMRKQQGQSAGRQGKGSRGESPYCGFPEKELLGQGKQA